MGAGELTFDSVRHEYRVGERRLISVTQALQLAGLIDSTWYTEEACTRGTYVAQATELMDLGELDDEKLDPALRPFCDAWQKFLTETRCEVVHIEHPVHSEVYQYAGTLDRWVTMPGCCGQDTIIDIKTGQPQPWHCLQTAAYARCLPGCFKRMAVYLHDDGTYKAVTHSDPNDINVFLAALAVAQWKINNGAKL